MNFQEIRDITVAGIRRWSLLIIVGLLILLVGGVYLSGYRIAPGFTIARIGTLQLTGLPDGTQIYIDYGLRGTASNGTFPAALIPGTHSVIASIDGAYPWEQIVTIVSNKTTTISPIIVPKTAVRAALPSAAQQTALAAIASTTLPTEAAPLREGCALLSVSNNQLIANAATSTPGCDQLPYACTSGSCSPTIVYAPTNPLKAVFPYPGHDDAVVVQVGDSLYALEIDPRSPQFFAPLYTGVALKSGDEPGSVIVVQDDEQVYSLGF